jgi:hypothetical protein
MCGFGTEYVVTGDITPSINGVYRIYDPTCYGGFDGNTCWTVVRTQTGGSLDCSSVVFGTDYGSCESCAPYPSGYYYNVQQIAFNCGGGIGTCTGTIGGNLIGYSTVALVVGNFYNSSGDVYVITGTTTPQSYDINITTWAGYDYDNCSDATQC